MGEVTLGGRLAGLPLALTLEAHPVGNRVLTGFRALGNSFRTEITPADARRAAQMLIDAADQAERQGELIARREAAAR